MSHTTLAQMYSKDEYSILQYQQDINTDLRDRYV